ncbi:MAG: SipW-dependent-type signal peptide-containing protein [Lachnospiraceae bacterium]|nr:SipW-dependent-type signal peptide-containing protein [Lachnospiraceae bacterium]
MKNGKLVATLGAVALVAAIGLGSTLAYLTDKTETVTNTFTLGNVSFNKQLGGGLAENPVTEVNGEYVILDKDKDTWVQTNTYTKVTPNEEVEKNPTAFIGSDSENAWLFVRVSKSSDFAAITFNSAFTKVGETDKYTDLRLTEEAVKNGKYEIFNHVTVANLDSTHAAKLDDITIKAALVQAEGVSAEAAYTQAQGLLAPAAAPVAPAED